MSEPLFSQTEDADRTSVYVGAHIPLRLYRLVTEEADLATVSRSEVLRWALAERYGQRQTAVRPLVGGEQQEAKEQDV